MEPSRARRVAVAVVVAVFLLETATVALDDGHESLGVPVLYFVYAVTQAIAGAVIVQRFPHHRIGWLLLLYALLNAVAADAALAYGVRAANHGWPFAAPSQLVAFLSWIFAASGLILLFLLFPDGRLADRRWRAVLWVWAIGAVLAVPGWTFNTTLGSSFVGGVNPYARSDVPAGLLFGVGASLISAALISSVVALVMRLRAAQGTQRDQLKWVVFAAAVVGVVLPASAALWTVWQPIQLLSAIALVLLPISACVAIVRHRLYDVDLLIARTAAYAFIAIVLGAAYLAVMVMAASVTTARFAAAFAALVVAVTFGPVHDRAQSLADRWLRPARHRAVTTLTQYVDALRTGTASVAELEGTLRRALHDDSCTLTLELPDSTAVDPEGRDASPRPRPESAPGRSTLRRATAAGVVASLSHREGDERVAAAVVEAGGLAIELAALQVQLRRHILEVEASRQRIQSVADEERRRIARDLHDGAQQRLVAIGLALRHAQLTADPATGTIIDEAVAELTTSIGELRELAGGLRPGALDEGLEPALRELAARTPVQLDLSEGSGNRFPGHIETAAYFVACEAVTNAVKHAGASRISLRLTGERDGLTVTVVDDGRGGAEPARGTGLLGLADRIRAHHGNLVIDSPLGGGTRVEAWLPCA